MVVNILKRAYFIVDQRGFPEVIATGFLKKCINFLSYLRIGLKMKITRGIIREIETFDWDGIE